MAMTALARASSRATPATAMPTAEPSATTGASGPSTAPNASVPIAASAIPGAYASGVGATLRPSIGRWPPSPGSAVRATRTISAPTTGRPTTRYQCSEPGSPGRTSHNQSSA
jgi:hypothetical protein